MLFTVNITQMSEELLQKFIEEVEEGRFLQMRCSVFEMNLNVFQGSEM